MGGVAAEGGERDVDVNVNVIPFIDLMSCLVAFLLATAVWSEYSQMPVKPKGIVRKTEIDKPEETVTASVLITENEIWAGLTVTGPRRILKDSKGHDWDGLGEVLKEFKDHGAFANRRDIEIAADDKVDYQTIITAMDTAVASELDDIGLVDPNSLTVKFRE